MCRATTPPCLWNPPLGDPALSAHRGRSGPDLGRVSDRERSGPHVLASRLARCLRRRPPLPRSLSGRKSLARSALSAGPWPTRRPSPCSRGYSATVTHRPSSAVAATATARRLSASGPCRGVDTPRLTRSREINFPHFQQKSWSMRVSGSCFLHFFHTCGQVCG